AHVRKLVEQIDATLGALDVVADAVEPVLDLQYLGDVPGLTEEGQELCLRGLEVAELSRKVCVFLRDVAGVGGVGIDLGAELADLREDVLVLVGRDLDCDGGELLVTGGRELRGGDVAAGGAGDEADLVRGAGDVLNLHGYGRRLHDLAVIDGGGGGRWRRP